MLNWMKWKVVVRFVDIGNIVDYHCSICFQTRVVFVFFKQEWH